MFVEKAAKKAERAAYKISNKLTYGSRKRKRDARVKAFEYTESDMGKEAEAQAAWEASLVERAADAGRDATEKMSKFMVNYAQSPELQAFHRYAAYVDELALEETMVLVYAGSNRVVSGNLFYVLKDLCTNGKYSGYRILLTTSEEKYEDNLDLLVNYGLVSKVELVAENTDEYYRAFASAKYLVSDGVLEESWIKKDGQVYLNTWHGTPIKTIGRHAKDFPYVGIGSRQRNLIESDYVLVSNEHTENHLMRDYMVEELACGQYAHCGQPCSDAFVDKSRRDKIRAELELTDKKVYVYMPTFRGIPDGVPEVTKADAYMLWYLNRIDKQLKDDECFFVKLHENAKVPFVPEDLFTHIKSFPKGYETYDFLNAADALVSDYSSVIFDFLNTGRKVILFTFDKDTYKKGHGLYFAPESLGLPTATDDKQLMIELRDWAPFDYSELKAKYCALDDGKSSAKICELFLDTDNSTVKTERIFKSGRDSVLIFAGPLIRNGITTSVINLLNNVNLKKRNYYLCAYNADMKEHGDVLKMLPKEVRWISMTAKYNYTYYEKLVHDSYMGFTTDFSTFLHAMKKRYEQEWLRLFGHADFAHVVQFNGYAVDSNMLFSTQVGKNTIYVHNDMQSELETKLNQHRDLLHYAYRTYTNVACVTEDIVESTAEIRGDKDNIKVVKNLINFEDILERSKKEVTLAKDTIAFPDKKSVVEVITDKSITKLITVGRFSAEKAHLRLIDAFAKLASEKKDVCLIIMGGYQNDGYYGKTRDYIAEKGLVGKVFLILDQPNPYCILKECAGFILGSYYEGFGLVLAEADILGVPVVSTDIVGPRLFMRKYNGTLVDNSENGVYEGLKMLAEGRINPINVDYSAYNREAIKEFEVLLGNR